MYYCGWDGGGSTTKALALDAWGVAVRTDCPVTGLRRKKNTFRVRTPEETLSADRVILTAGGAAAPKLGGVCDGYRLAEGLGHLRTKLSPSLVQATQPIRSHR